jgi:hypothetical protein
LKAGERGLVAEPDGVGPLQRSSVKPIITDVGSGVSEGRDMSWAIIRGALVLSR